MPLEGILLPLFGPELVRLGEGLLGRGKFLRGDGGAGQVVQGVGVLVIPGLGADTGVLVEVLHGVAVDFPGLGDSERGPLLPQLLDGAALAVLVVVEDLGQGVQLEDVVAHVRRDDFGLPGGQEGLDGVGVIAGQQFEAVWSHTSNSSFFTLFTLSCQRTL